MITTISRIDRNEVWFYDELDDGDWFLYRSQLHLYNTGADLRPGSRVRLVLSNYTLQNGPYNHLSIYFVYPLHETVDWEKHGF